jgi:hypothetical protein
MLLAATGQQEFARLRIAVEAQRLVFFQNAVHGLAHAVFVVARLGFDGEGDGRLRQFHRRIDHVRSPYRQRVAGQRVLELGHRADIAGVHFGNRLQRFPLRTAANVRQPLGAAAASLSRLASFFTTPVITLKYVMRPENGSAVVLKTNADAGAGAGDLLRGFLAADQAAIPSRSVGAGRFSTMKLSSRSVPTLCRTGGAEDRINPHLGDGLLQAVDDLLDFERAFVEELLHESVIALGHHLDERFVGLLGGVGQVGGNLALLPLPSPSGECRCRPSCGPGRPRL